MLVTSPTGGARGLPLLIHLGGGAVLLVRNLPGMGLGVYICRNIVERQGGTIAARSSGEWRGTTFEITLPCAASAQPPVPPDEDAPAPSPEPIRPYEPTSEPLPA